LILLDFLIGLAIFLYGMHELERGIRKLSDAKLRYWLRSSTGTTLGSVSTGIFSTALLQSSSMVSLMTLAFAAAGILPLVNSVGIILGANLGTTFTGWIVATLGFKLNLEAISLPLVAASAGVIVLVGQLKKLRYTALAVLGLGFLLFGLSLMKESMDSLPEIWNVSQIQGQPAIIYLLFGVLLAALIQSSSAAMMMALAALNADILALPEAVALVIGADLGTTSTTALGSLLGGVIKKQLALAHFLFNLVVDVSAFLFLLPLLPWLMSSLTIDDPLYSLVAFHTVMNLLGLMIFTPFIVQFTNFIIRRVPDRDEGADNPLRKVTAEIPEAAMVALDDAVRALVNNATAISAQVMGMDAGHGNGNGKGKDAGIATAPRGWLFSHEQDFRGNYESLKRAEAEILRYALEIQARPLLPEQTRGIDRLLRTTRSAVYAVKTLKDIEHNLKDLRYGENNTMRKLYSNQQAYINQTAAELIDLLDKPHPQSFMQEKLEEMRSANDKQQEDMNHLVYAHVQTLFADQRTLSTELNVNREIHHGCKALIEATQNLVILTERVESTPETE